MNNSFKANIIQMSYLEYIQFLLQKHQYLLIYAVDVMLGLQEIKNNLMNSSM